jgi:hypothetical protein
MPDAELAKLIGNIKAVLESMETQVERGRVSNETLAAMKSSVDEVGSGCGPSCRPPVPASTRTSWSVFRLRRATEICRGLADDIGAGRVGSQHTELKTLGEAAGALAWALNPGA